MIRYFAIATVVVALIAMAAIGGSALGQQQNPAPAVNHSQLELLTSYPHPLVTSLNRPDATSPELLKQLPINRPPIITVKLYEEYGGKLSEHWWRFKEMAEHNNKVEVLGVCASACTVVVSSIKKENLCFGKDATLQFHQARWPNGEQATYATQNMYDSYPADIRKWIDDHGGVAKIPYSGWFYLYAEELWQMGYKRCSPG